MAAENRQAPNQDKQISSGKTPELIRLARKGDENAFDKLFCAYSPMIGKLIEKYRVSGTPEEDLHSEALHAFANAVLRYDTEQEDVTFGLYAQICIANRLSSAFRTFQKKQQTVSFEELDPDAVPAGEESDPAHYILEEERYADICRKMEAVLSPAEREVWMLFISGMTAPQISDQLDLPRKSVENTLYRSRKKLRESFSQS